MTNNVASIPTEAPPVLDCEGYRKLLAAVESDEAKSPRGNEYRAKFAWAIARAKHYAEKTGLTPEAILDSWEKRRDYWFLNFYQEANQPEIKADRVRIFETVEDLLKSIGSAGFRCPSCCGVSKSPYECNSGKKAYGKICDWKVYGLFGHMGKGIAVFVKEKFALENLFMPIAWEIEAPEPAPEEVPQRPAPKKKKSSSERSKARYREFQSSDTSETFFEWLKRSEENRRRGFKY